MRQFYWAQLILDVLMARKILLTLCISRINLGCGGRIRTYDLQVMSEENVALNNPVFQPFICLKYMIIWDL